LGVGEKKKKKKRLIKVIIKTMNQEKNLVERKV